MLSVWLPYHRNQTVIAEVEKLGDFTDSEIVRPAWIPDAVDDEHLWLFERVILVDLPKTQLNEPGLEYLRGLKALHGLGLRNPQISDAGLERLKGLTNLVGLGLQNTKISDAGLKHLRKLTNPQELYLKNTDVTQAGIEKLKVSLPGCYIVWTRPAE
jgi:hypothetical protein